MGLQVHKVTSDLAFVDNSQVRVATRRGTTYYVHATLGSDSRSGKSWRKSFLTMSKAFTSVASGDTIVFAGKIREQLTAPVQIFDVLVVGAGNRHRHADSTPSGGELAANTWTTPASGATTAPLVKVMQQGWRFENILFAGPTDHACVQLFRDAGADNAERDASHASFYNCRFASGFDGISDTGGCFNVSIRQCDFQSLTNFAILGVGSIGVGQSNWEIVDNNFREFTNGVKIAAFQCRIQNNVFTDGETPNTTVVLNVSNGGGGNNFIVDNWFQGTTANFNSPDVVGNATDVWYNHALNTVAAGTSGVWEVGQPA